MPHHIIQFAACLNGAQFRVGLDVGALQAVWGGPPGTWNALIDTGSTSTAISPAVKTALNPRIIGRARVSRPGLGNVWGDTDFVRLKFEGHSIPGRWFN